MAGSYVQRSRHGTVYLFRRRVPLDLRDVLRRATIYLSLRTEIACEARRRARALAVATDDLFANLRDMRKKTPSVTKTDYAISMGTDPATGRTLFTFLDVKPGEEESVAKAAHELRKVVGDSDLAARTPPSRSPTPTVEEAIGAYLGSAIKPTTVKAYIPMLACFSNFVGKDTRLGEITQHRFAEFADDVRAHADWATKTKRSYIVTAAALFAHARGRNGDVPHISTKGLTPKKAAAGKRQRREHSLQELEVLVRNAARYRTSAPSKWWATVASMFLGGRIEELAQAHVNGDFVKDAVSQIWYLNVTEEQPDGTSAQGARWPKSVKTGASWRKVPIHPRLIELGFLEFLAQERAAGAVTPFARQWEPYRDLKTGLVKHSHAISKWGHNELGRLRDKGLLNTSNTVYFHSMRYAFATLLAKAGIDEEYRSAVNGHERGNGMNAKIYNKAAEDVSVTLPLIEKGLAPLVEILDRVLAGDAEGTSGDGKL